MTKFPGKYSGLKCARPVIEFFNVITTTACWELSKLMTSERSNFGVSGGRVTSGKTTTHPIGPVIAN